MRARLPDAFDRRAEAGRRRAVTWQLLLFQRTLYERFGWARERLLSFYGALDNVIRDVADYDGSQHCPRNKTWHDELDYWAEKKGLRVPPLSEYVLVIDGGAVAHTKQRLLLIMQLYALQSLGFGEKRLHQALDAYAENADLYGRGLAKWTASELKAWADSHNIYYPGCPEEEATYLVKKVNG